MKSASEVSMEIRKKKKMKEDPDVVDLAGIPEDGTDLYVKKGQEATDAMNENMPMKHSDGNDLSPAQEMSEEKDDKKERRKARIGKMSMMK